MDGSIGRITFGILSSALPLSRPRDAPGLLADWQVRFELDLSTDEALVGVLLRAALARNPQGPTLFATSVPARVAGAAAAAAVPQIATERALIDAVRQVAQAEHGAR